jgi:hypothetical protein
MKALFDRFRPRAVKSTPASPRKREQGRAAPIDVISNGRDYGKVP